jgi:hypothetical protein
MAPPPPPPPTTQQSQPQSPNLYNYGYGYAVPGQAPREYPSQPKHSQHLVQQQSSTQPAAKKRKVEEWYCDACELSLDSEKALKSHKKSHVKCTVCSFEGAPKIVKGHFQAAHGKFSGSGFKTVTVAIPGCKVQRFKICVGNRPEDVKQWIADRKKKFPRSQQSSQSNSGTAEESKKAEEKTGMSSLLAGYGSSSSSEDEDDENDKKKDETTTKTEQVAESRNDYKQSTSLPPRQQSLSSQQPRSSRPCRFFMRNGSCLNGDACRFSHDSTSLAMNASRNKLQRRGEQTSSTDTLLRKLLANDMRRETTITLQLLEYIVDCNFLQEQRESSNTSK